jgi:glycosyltransferase involved in cell wall biosynthesis
MKVLVAHNFYQSPGGEDVVFLREKTMLASRGHEVIEYTRHNREIASAGLWDYATLPARVIWNWDSYNEVKRLVAKHKPDVAHFHNIFPLISPAAYSACWEAGVPVVQSLHNSRLFCPAGIMYYNGAFCQDCLGKAFPWPGVVRACYRKSHLQTGVVGLMSTVHRSLGTWNQMVSRYVVFTEFYRRTFQEAGFPAGKLVIKPHFIEDPGVRQGMGSYALYVGRLSEDKGIATLLHAWQRVQHIPLKICGEGPLDSMVRDFAGKAGGAVEVLPFIPPAQVMKLIKGAAFLLWPSEFRETFGLVAVEAFACGVPVIASAVGGMPGIVSDRCTGLTFQVGDVVDLAAKVAWAWEHTDELDEMGRAARSEYEAKYTTERNYNSLLQIYFDAIAQRRADEVSQAVSLKGVSH